MFSETSVKAYPVNSWRKVGGVSKCLKKCFGSFIILFLRAPPFQKVLDPFHLHVLRPIPPSSLVRFISNTVQRCMVSSSKLTNIFHTFFFFIHFLPDFFPSHYIRLFYNRSPSYQPQKDKLFGLLIDTAVSKFLFNCPRLCGNFPALRWESNSSILVTNHAQN